MFICVSLCVCVCVKSGYIGLFPFPVISTRDIKNEPNTQKGEQFCMCVYVCVCEKSG